MPLLRFLPLEKLGRVRWSPVELQSSSLLRVAEANRACMFRWNSFTESPFLPFCRAPDLGAKWYHSSGEYMEPTLTIYRAAAEAKDLYRPTRTFFIFSNDDSLITPEFLDIRLLVGKISRRHCCKWHNTSLLCSLDMNTIYSVCGKWQEWVKQGLCSRYCCEHILSRSGGLTLIKSPWCS